MPDALGGSLAHFSQQPTPAFHLAINNVQDLNVMAELLRQSGFFGNDSQAAIAVRLMAGLEAGFTPFAAITGTYVVNGKPAFGANMLAQAIKKSGKYDYRVVKKTIDGCTIRIIKAGTDELIGEEEFTQQDAQTAGLWHGPTWKKYPKQMLFNRCITMAMRTHTPEVLGGHTAYTPEELIAAQPDFKQKQYGEIDEHGMPIEEVKVIQVDDVSASASVPNSDREPAAKKSSRKATPKPKKVAQPQPEPEVDQAAVLAATKDITVADKNQIISGLNYLAENAKKDDKGTPLTDVVLSEFRVRMGMAPDTKIAPADIKTEQHAQILLELLEPHNCLTNA